MIVARKKPKSVVAPKESALVKTSPAQLPIVVETVDQDIRDFIPVSDDYSRLWQIHRRYLREVEGECVPFDPRYDEEPGLEELTCPECGVRRIIDPKEAIATCPQCMRCIPFQEWGRSSIPFNHPVEKKRIGNSYERVSHFNTWLQNVQGSRMQDIPEELYTELWEECRKLQIRVVERRNTRRLLKRLGYHKFYDSVVRITWMLNDIPPPRFSEEEIEFFRLAFYQGQELFDRCPQHLKGWRKNFISYSYFFYQMCYMKSWDHYLPYFDLLQGDDNLLRHDRIWKWMCENKTSQPLWTFYPTV